MTINNLEKFVGSLWDWGTLNGCFGGTMIRPTDVDGLVERRGRFLVLEAKGNGVGVPQAQAIVFEQLRKLNVFTIIVVWGKCPEVKSMKVYSPVGVSTKYSATLDDFRQRVSRWYRDANSIRP